MRENPFVPKSLSGAAPESLFGLKLKEPDVMITIESACAGAAVPHTISATVRARRHETCRRMPTSIESASAGGSWGSRPRFAMLWTLIVSSS